MDWIRVSGGFSNSPNACLPRDDARGVGGALGRYANPSGKPCQETVFWCPAYSNGCYSPFMMTSSVSGRKPSAMKNPSGIYLLIEEKEDYEISVVETSVCGTPY